MKKNKKPYICLDCQLEYEKYKRKCNCGGDIRKKINEARWTREVFMPWYKKSKFTAGIEIKVSPGNTLPWSKFREQQIPNLHKTKHSFLYWKFTDASAGIKKYDVVGLYKEKAYVVILFNKDTKRGRKKFYMIDIDEVIKIKESGAKSIKKSDCELNGITIKL